MRALLVVLALLAGLCVLPATVAGQEPAPSPEPAQAPPPTSDATPEPTPEIPPPPPDVSYLPERPKPKNPDDEIRGKGEGAVKARPRPTRPRPEQRRKSADETTAAGGAGTAAQACLTARERRRLARLLERRDPRSVARAKRIVARCDTQGRRRTDVESRSRDASGSGPRAPSAAAAILGAPLIGVPDVAIDRFRIPPFLLPIYQAAGIQYGVPWEILAAINEIETDYGRNVAVSSAGAEGWMQFLPSTWKRYGTDANRDGRRDPGNPVDAIFAAARYLRAAGAQEDLERAIFAYNHADWYVRGVLRRARRIQALPADLIGSLTGLTEGLFPLAARSRYRHAWGVRRTVRVRSRPGAAAVAVGDGRVLRIGSSPRLGRFVVLRDEHGHRYTYGHLKTVAATYSLPRRTRVRPVRTPKHDPAPTGPATAGRRGADEQRRRLAARSTVTHPPRSAKARAIGRHVRVLPLRKGSRVVAGTVLGRIGRTRPDVRPYLLFEVRPAGRRTRRVDPKPILDGWRLLERTAIRRATGRDRAPTLGQILLMGKQQLIERVLGNPRIELYSCGRRDVRAGIVDRRVLVALELLAASGLNPSVTSLRCGHSYLTASGNVSHHSTGDAVDIAALNGVPVLGNQGPGSITESAVRRLLGLQGALRPAQIITLMTVEGAPNTYAMADHADHIHLGFQPERTTARTARRIDALLAPGQWDDLVERLGRIENPAVPAPER